MKFTTSFTAALLAAISIASPLPQQDQENKHEEVRQVHHLFNASDYLSPSLEKSLVEGGKFISTALGFAALDFVTVAAIDRALEEINRIDLPKVSIPKVSIPKVTIPKISLPTRDIEPEHSAEPAGNDSTAKEHHFWLIDAEITEDVKKTAIGIAEAFTDFGIEAIGSKIGEVAWEGAVNAANKINHSKREDAPETSEDESKEVHHKISEEVQKKAHEIAEAFSNYGLSTIDYKLREAAWNEFVKAANKISLSKREDGAESKADEQPKEVHHWYLPAKANRDWIVEQLKNAPEHVFVHLIDSALGKMVDNLANSPWDVTTPHQEEKPEVN